MKGGKIMFKVTVNNQNIFLCEENTNLLRLLTENGYNIPCFCGGLGKCGKCIVFVDGKKELSCEYYVKNDISVELLQIDELTEKDLISYESNVILKKPELIVDIGTTTVSVAVFDLEKRCFIDELTLDNPQKIHGADILSRINATKEKGVSALQNEVVSAIQNAVSEFCLRYRVKEFPKMIVSANSVMTHIFSGVSPESLGVAPYEMKFNESLSFFGEKVGLTNVRNIKTIELLHSYFGGDAVAGLTLVSMPKNAGVNLFIDLGTNAEIALITEEKIYCTSASSGPCFEGGNISIGVTAKEGAIYSFSIKNGVAEFKTVDGENPVGICGTGLIDAVSELKDNFVIDYSGKFCEGSDFEIAENLFISQADIREFQSAKSAVKTAIELLFDISGKTVEDIETLYVSGGFSFEINLKNAKNVGLFPIGDYEFKPLNNSSLSGVAEYLVNPEIIKKIIRKCEYVDLTEHPSFQKNFIENINFN